MLVSGEERKNDRMTWPSRNAHGEVEIPSSRKRESETGSQTCNGGETSYSPMSTKIVAMGSNIKGYLNLDSVGKKEIKRPLSTGNAT